MGSNILEIGQHWTKVTGKVATVIPNFAKCGPISKIRSPTVLAVNQ